jgi:hypothetical protein
LIVEPLARNNSNELNSSINLPFSPLSALFDESKGYIENKIVLTRAFPRRNKLIGK